MVHRVLPKRPVASQSPAAPSCANGEILRQRPFMGFTLLAGSYRDPVPPALSRPPAHIQSLPDATRLLGGVRPSAVIGVLLQLPASRLVERRLGVPLAMGLGMGMMGLSYLALPLLTRPTAGVLTQVAPCFPWAPSSASLLLPAQLPPPAPLSSSAATTASMPAPAAAWRSLATCLSVFMLGMRAAAPTAIWHCWPSPACWLGWPLYPAAQRMARFNLPHQ